MDPQSADQDYDQPPGLKFSEASLILARAAPLSLPGGRAADFGCGCGAVGLEALASGRLAGVRKFYFVEKEAFFYSFLVKNILKCARPRGPELFPLIRSWQDLKAGDLGGPLDYIISNPPWHEPSRRGSPDPRRRAMRQELSGRLADLLEAAAGLLRPGGCLTLAWPGDGQKRLIQTLARTPEMRLSRLERLQNCRAGLLLAWIAKSASLRDHLG